MVQGDGEFVPRARKDGLIVKELEDELLVYDRESNKAHTLNKTAAMIWKQCDGQTRVNNLRARLETAGVVFDETLIWHALDQLSKASLLDEQIKRPPEFRRLSRRELIRRVGVVAASLPVVVSIVAPNVFAAASCTQTCLVIINCTVTGCQGSCPLTGPNANRCQPG
jgi:coenzyme PQQ synthesis protein D (PqqD)